MGLDLAASAASEAMWAPHRRPAFPVNAPALTRHVCIRFPEALDPTKGQDDTDYRRRLTGLVTDINSYLDSIQTGDGDFKPRFVPPGISPEDSDKIERYDTLFFRIQIEGQFRLGVRADIHNEYYTITFYADSFALDAPAASLCGRVVKVLSDVQSTDVREPGDAEQPLSLLYDEFWSLLDKPLKIASIPGTVFADFRGFAACPPHINQQLNPHGQHRVELAPAQMTSHRTRRNVDDRVYEFVELRPHFFAQLLGMEKSLYASRDPVEGNVVLSGMLDGAAIYGSTLQTRKPHRASPLRFFVVYNGYSSNQLGRLIRRLHVLGELRIAALTDYGQIRAANRKIRHLETNIRQAEEIKGLHRLTHEDMERLTREHHRIGAHCAGGLVYRVARSRAYARAYRERLQDLRIVRIEGWQTYDEFMRRNLFLEFDYVSLVGERYDALAAKLRQMSSLAELHRLQNHTHDLRRLQRLADWVGGAAFVYYGGKILDEIAEDAAYLACMLKKICAIGDASSFFPVACFAIVFLVYLPLRRRIMRGRPAPPPTVRLPLPAT